MKKKSSKIILVLIAAAVLAAVYFANFEKSDSPVLKKETVATDDSDSAEVKIKETYKPAHGDSAENSEADYAAGETEPSAQVSDSRQNKAESDSAPKQNTDRQKNEKVQNICILSVRCDTAVGKVPAEKSNIIPADGVIFPKTDVKIEDGDSVFDILLREMKNNNIHMEFSKTPGYDNVYIEGIGNLYEFDCGELSGWMYKVNGETPNYGCSEFKVSPGDRIEFIYTCNLGRDIGGSAAVN